MRPRPAVHLQIVAEEVVEIVVADDLTSRIIHHNNIIIAAINVPAIIRANEVLRRLEAPGTAGFHRVTWDLRTEAPKGVPRAARFPNHNRRYR